MDNEAQKFGGLLCCTRFFIEKTDLLDTCQQLGVGFDDVETKTPKTSDRKSCSIR